MTCCLGEHICYQAGDYAVTRQSRDPPGRRHAACCCRRRQKAISGSAPKPRRPASTKLLSAKCAAIRKISSSHCLHRSRGNGGELCTATYPAEREPRAERHAGIRTSSGHYKFPDDSRLPTNPARIFASPPPTVSHHPLPSIHVPARSVDIIWKIIDKQAQYCSP